MMKQITILGATGMVGRNLLQKAGEKDLKVKILARDASKLNDHPKSVEVIEGSYFDKNILKDAIEGSNAILSTIGPSILYPVSATEEKRYIDSMAFIIEQMEANNQHRWINISGAGVKMTNENMPLARKLLRMKLMAKSKSIMTIKERELQMLENSDLDWTSVRSPLIRGKVNGDFCADENTFCGNSVDLNQLSDFMLSEINDNKWIKMAPVVGTK